MVIDSWKHQNNQLIYFKTLRSLLCQTLSLELFAPKEIITWKKTQTSHQGISLVHGNCWGRANTRTSSNTQWRHLDSRSRKSSWKECLLNWQRARKGTARNENTCAEVQQREGVVRSSGTIGGSVWIECRDQQMGSRRQAMAGQWQALPANLRYYIRSQRQWGNKILKRDMIESASDFIIHLIAI